jgi:V/A-type H+-transporting ATPase subunit C
VAGSYDYLNARAKALKANLFPTLKLRELSRSGSLPTLVETLAATSAYAADIRAGDLPETAAGCEAALLRSLSTTFHRLWTQADNEARRWLEIWLAPWDLANIHSVLRALRTGQPAAMLAGWWNATGTLSIDTLNQLAGSGTMDVFARRLSSKGSLFGEIARALRAGASEPQRRVEDALVLVWAQWAARAVETGGADAETFTAFLGWEIEGQNLRTALRLARDGGGASAPFLPGGTRLTRGDWSRIAQQTRLEDAVPLVATTPLAEMVVTRPVEGDIGLEQIDHRIRSFVLDRSVELYKRSDPLGVGVLLHFVRLKANEIDNLRLIAYGLERRMPAALIEDQLTLAQDQSHLQAR